MSAGRISQATFLKANNLRRLYLRKKLSISFFSLSKMQAPSVIRNSGMETYQKKLQKILAQGADFVSTTDARCTTPSGSEKYHASL